MSKIQLFAIGGSAGGLEAVRKIAASLPKDFPAPICLTLHVSPESPGLVPELLNLVGPLKARHPDEGETLQPGHIYVAPPDHHLLIDEQRRLRLPRGPKENRFRPAIDPLFRSAAVVAAERACGIVLSGALDDGAAGLAAIKSRGGAAIVQDPADATVKSMPQAALNAVRAVDRRLPAHRIAEAMSELALNYTPARTETAMNQDLEKELRYAMGADYDVDGVKTMGDPSLFTCPDCHGAMVQLRDAVPPRFRCHTGHAYSLDSLAAAQHDRVEDSLWNAVRALEEQAALLEHFAEHFTGEDAPSRRESTLREAEEAQWRSRLVRDAVRSNR